MSGDVVRERPQLAGRLDAEPGRDRDRSAGGVAKHGGARRQRAGGGQVAGAVEPVGAHQQRDRFGHRSFDLEIGAVFLERVLARRGHEQLVRHGRIGGERLPADQVFEPELRAADARGRVAAGDQIGEAIRGIPGPVHEAAADGDVVSLADAERGDDAAAARGDAVVVDHVAAARLRQAPGQVVAAGGRAEARRGVDGVVQLHAFAEPVRAADLDAVVGERAGEHTQVPVARAQHAPHVVGQRLVAGGVVGGIVADVERAEAGAEAAGADHQLVGDAKIEIRHRQLEAVAAVADLHVRGHVIGDVRRQLQRDLGREAVVRRCARRACWTRRGRTGSRAAPTRRSCARPPPPARHAAAPRPAGRRRAPGA